MEAIKALANIIILALSLSFFGGFAKVTYELGKSALSLHERGLPSLGRFNRSLVEGDTLK